MTALPLEQNGFGVQGFESITQAPIIAESTDPATAERTRFFGKESLLRAVGHAATATGLTPYVETVQQYYDGFTDSTREVVRKGRESLHNWSSIGQGRKPDPSVEGDLGVPAWPLRARAWEKTATAARGSSKWVNLLAGEAIALAPQGLLQSYEAHPAVSYAAFMAASLAVETAFSKPIANHNESKYPHTGETSEEKIKRNAGAAAEALFLGGAWGTESGEQNNKEKWGSIGSYMLWAAGLGALAEQNNLAEQAINSPVFYGGLLAMAGIKTYNHACGYEGIIDRIAIRASKLTRTIMDKLNVGREAPFKPRDLTDSELLAIK